MYKIILGAAMVLFAFAAAFAIVAMALWFLIPVAFPLLGFEYYQALALTGVLTIVGAPVVLQN